MVVKNKYFNINVKGALSSKMQLLFPEFTFIVK